MLRNVKCPSLVVFTACVLVLPLLAVSPAQAQTDSITGSFTTITGSSGAAPEGGQQGNCSGSGYWSTDAGSTCQSMKIYSSTDNGKTYTQVNASVVITGVGTTAGSWGVLFYLPTGNYKMKVEMTTTMNHVVSFTQNLTVTVP